MKVKNLINDNGNRANNQYVIYDDNGDIYFKSYNVIIANKPRRGKVIISKDYYDYSRTTTKHLCIFLRNFCNFPYYRNSKKDVEKWVEEKNAKWL